MRRFILLSLALLMVCIACPALAEIDAATAIGLFFPGSTLAPAEDFFYEPSPPPVIRDYPEDGMLLRLRETFPMGQQTLIVVEGIAQHHMVGWHHLLFGIYDTAQGTLVGEPLWLQADSIDYYIMYRDGRPSVLYVSSDISTGLEACGGARMEWNGATWQMVWPAGGYTDPAYGEFWDVRKGMISYEAPGGVVLYQRVPAQPAEGQERSLSDYAWQLEGYQSSLTP